MGFSGKDGTVKVGLVDVCEVIKWTFDPSVSVSSYNSNKTGGHKKKVAGVKDSKGTIEIKVDETGTLDFQPGDNPTLLLHADDTGNNYFEVDALIASSPISVDVDNGEVVSATYNFEASGYTPFGIFA